MLSVRVLRQLLQSPLAAKTFRCLWHCVFERVCPVSTGHNTRLLKVNYFHLPPAVCSTALGNSVPHCLLLMGTSKQECSQTETMHRSFIFLSCILIKNIKGKKDHFDNYFKIIKVMSCLQCCSRMHFFFLIHLQQNAHNKGKNNFKIKNKKTTKTNNTQSFTVRQRLTI